MNSCRVSYVTRVSCLLACLLAAQTLRAEELAGPQEIRFYPRADLQLQPGFPLSGSVLVQLSQNETSEPSDESVTVSPSSDGALRFSLTCRFYGPGWILIVNAGQVLEKLAMRCEPPDLQPRVPGLPAPQASALAAASAAASSAFAPAMLPARIESYSWTLHGEEETREVFRNPGVTTTLTTRTLQTRMLTIADGQSCDIMSRSGQSCCSTTDPDDTSCAGCQDFDDPGVLVCAESELLPSEVGLEVTAGRRIRDFTSSSRDDYKRYTYTTETRVGLVFDSADPIELVDVQAFTGSRDDQVPELRASGALEDFALAGPDFQTVVPAFASAVDPVEDSACPGNEYATTVPLVWSIAGPPSGNRVSIVLSPTSGGCSYSVEYPEDPSDPDARHGVELVTDSRLNGFLRAFTAVSPLAIQPQETLLAPTWLARASDPHALGRTSTSVRASLNDVNPGTYRIRISADAFDAAVAGHAHGSPPSALWGRFEPQASAGGKPAGECEIAVDATRTGSCDVRFEAGELSGRVALLGRTLIAGGARQARTRLDVQVPLLYDASYLVPTLRDPAAPHADGVAFHAAQPALAGLAALGSDLTRHTLYLANQSTLAKYRSHPQGLSLQLGDVSLPWGGLFDVDGGWQPPHALHRDGRGVDIDLQALDVRDIGSTTPGRTEALSPQFYKVLCWGIGGTRVLRDNAIHCEFR